MEGDIARIAMFESQRWIFLREKEKKGNKFEEIGTRKEEKTI